MTPEERLEYYDRLTADIQKDPEMALELDRLIRKVRPQSVSPRLDLVNRFETNLKKELEDRDKKLAELEESQKRKEHLDRLEKERNQLRKAPYNFDDEDIAEVEKLITEKQFPSYETAAQYLRATQATVTPSGSGARDYKRKKPAEDLREKIKDPFKKLFPRKAPRFQEEFDKAYQEALSGEYLNQ
jgi:hypothetical protein